mgnify:CR=1 FL=1
MQIPELLTAERIACQQECSSKKRSLDRLGKLLADALPDFTDGEIFDSLIGRERLGSTGLGNGVALPHGRVQGLKQPIAALLVLSEIDPVFHSDPNAFALHEYAPQYWLINGQAFADVPEIDVVPGVSISVRSWRWREGNSTRRWSISSSGASRSMWALPGSREKVTWRAGASPTGWSHAR